MATHQTDLYILFNCTMHFEKFLLILFSKYFVQISERNTYHLINAHDEILYGPKHIIQKRMNKQNRVYFEQFKISNVIQMIRNFHIDIFHIQTGMIELFAVIQWYLSDYNSSIIPEVLQLLKSYSRLQRTPCNTIQTQTHHMRSLIQLLPHNEFMSL